MVMIVGLRFIVPSSQDMDVKIHWTKLFFFDWEILHFSCYKIKIKNVEIENTYIEKLLKSKKYEWNNEIGNSYFLVLGYQLHGVEAIPQW